MMKGSIYGIHRVIEPVGTLPQAAWKIDNNMDINDNEILIDVDVLNIDAASFTQIKEEAHYDIEKIKNIMQDIVKQRGKHHNPVTGSGGMLVGTVRGIGSDLKDRIDLKVGDRIVTLVSLSLTPLVIKTIKKVHIDRDQVEIEGQAILFETGLYAKLPTDLADTLALAVLDVAGAPAQTAKLVKPGDTVVIIGGGGKSGTLCMYEARRRAGVTGTIIGISYDEASCQRLRELDWADHVLQMDARDAVSVMDAVAKVTQNKMADVTINCVNIPGTEMASILATRDEGTVYFFSMSTSFTAAALGAEGVGKDVTMMIGNGYTHGHAEVALNILRESPQICQLFQKIYV
ncbi:L-erythro-3,5-diaminohexanoate dehydrogenase [Pelosinus sp. sgz500959]|uniref:L-erythro-3,5-diaminohexanoate dehydrogenase n=1 Tax=Pelosinus sp. sgz500959 TaxID=3242472 RepID=UPI00366CD8B1